MFFLKMLINVFWNVFILKFFFIEGKVFLDEFGNMLGKWVFKIGFGLILRNIILECIFLVFLIVFWNWIGWKILVV